ncbi:MAG: FAD:protein FMN transferase [Chitinophagales bacterium]
MKFLNCLLIILVFVISAASSQSFIDPDKAFANAAELKKEVLIVFSGSDWCLPCIRLEKDILRDPDFMMFAENSLVILTADFPQKKKLPPGQITINEKLAEEYNPHGIFPLLVLVNPDKTVLTSLEYEHYNPQQFIKQIQNALYSQRMKKEYKSQAKLMGSAFEFVIVAEEDRRGARLLRQCSDEVIRIEKLLTEFGDHSDTSKINRAAGNDAVEVSAEAYDLIRRCQNLSKLTHGAFDISSGVLKKLYNFKGLHFELPTPERIRETLEKTGYEKINLAPGHRVALEVTGMHIGFGAIGKGYAADKVKQLMLREGVEAGVINASGDLTVWGQRANGMEWNAGIAHPDHPSKMICWLPLNGQSIATSGDYEQHFEYQGIRYSHNINPKTGYPVQGIKSVSIVSPAAELSDGLATAVTVMGIEAGLHLVNQLPQTHCIIVDSNNKTHHSRNIDILQHA